MKQTIDSYWFFWNSYGMGYCRAIIKKNKHEVLPLIFFFSCLLRSRVFRANTMLVLKLSCILKYYINPISMAFYFYLFLIHMCFTILCFRVGLMGYLRASSNWIFFLGSRALPNNTIFRLDLGNLFANAHR